MGSAAIDGIFVYSRALLLRFRRKYVIICTMKGGKAMSRGIIVFGASGSGTSTLGKELARLLGFQHLDLDDYFWRWDTETPFTVPCPREKRIAKLMQDVENCAYFVMSGSICGWDTPFAALFDLAVFITAPAAVRAERLHARELARFGERILAGGDMYEGHNNFLDWAERYDTMDPPERCLKLHEQWAETLMCPVLRVDGIASIVENAAHTMEQYSLILPSNLKAALNGFTA